MMVHALRFPIDASSMEIVGHDDEVIGCGWQGHARAPGSYEQYWLLRAGYRDIFRVLAGGNIGITMRAASVQSSSLEAWRHERPLKWHPGAEYVISAGKQGAPLRGNVNARGLEEPDDCDMDEEKGAFAGALEQVYYRAVEILSLDPHESLTPVGYVYTQAGGAKTLRTSGLKGALAHRPVYRVQEHWVLHTQQPHGAIKIRRPLDPAVRSQLETHFSAAMAKQWRPTSSHLVYECTVYDREPN